MKISGINENQYTYKGGAADLNAVNPIAIYTSRFFKRMATVSRTNLETFSDELSLNAKVIKTGKSSLLDINPANSKNYVLFLHGMGKNVSNYQKLYKSILDLDAGVCAVEYRSYGLNKKSRLTEDRLKKDVDKAYQYLAETRGIKPQNITVIGHSMGGALAADFASRHKDIKSLILVSPLSNLLYIGKKFMLNKRIGVGVPEKVKQFTDKCKPLKWLYSLNFNSIKKIKNIESPTYIIQSKNDSITTYQGARTMAKHARRKGILQKYVLFPQGGHDVDTRKLDAVMEILNNL